MLLKWGAMIYTSVGTIQVETSRLLAIPAIRPTTVAACLAHQKETDFFGVPGTDPNLYPEPNEDLRLTWKEEVRRGLPEKLTSQEVQTITQVLTLHEKAFQNHAGQLGRVH